MTGKIPSRKAHLSVCIVNNSLCFAKVRIILFNHFKIINRQNSVLVNQCMKVKYIQWWTKSMQGYFYEILHLNLAQISSIYRLTSSFMAIWDDLQWFVSITGLILLYRYHIDMCLCYALRVSKGTLNPEKTTKKIFSKEVNGRQRLFYS